MNRDAPALMSGIGINGVTKRFGAPGDASGYLALENVSLDIVGCEFLSLVGRSGCGKSTLLRLIAGLLEPTDGTLSVGVAPVGKPTRQVGFVFQKPTLLPWYTLLENILLPHRIAGTLDDAARRRATELLEITALDTHREKYPEELSGGMLQRASIARALVTSPKVLLMDEPFSALDEFTRETLNDELLRIWTEARTTVVFVTHNIAEAVYLSDRIAVMDTGPGRIRSVIDCDLPRPRGNGTRTSSAYYDTITRVRGAFEDIEAMHPSKSVRTSVLKALT
jgi:NitT/TauT family transport system ATP-binding protein